MTLPLLPDPISQVSINVNFVTLADLQSRLKIVCSFPPQVNQTSSRVALTAMELSPKTKINELLSGYPFLLEFFLGRSPKFKVLKNPLTRKTVGKLATMTQVASIGELDLDQLLADIAREIKEKTGEQVAIKQAMNAAETPAPEDREARQEILKGIIRDLHNGEEMAILKQRFHDLIKNIDASEIAAMEQGLIDEGMPASEVKLLCDVHVEVFEE